jgi:hypothetical protein
VVAVVAVAVDTSAICGAMISNFPKTRLLFVRLSISGLRMSGIELLERIPLFVVVRLVVSILLLSR